MASIDTNNLKSSNKTPVNPSYVRINLNTSLKDSLNLTSEPEKINFKGSFPSKSMIEKIIKNIKETKKVKITPYRFEHWVKTYYQGEIPPSWEDLDLIGTEKTIDLTIYKGIRDRFKDVLRPIDSLKIFISTKGKGKTKNIDKENYDKAFSSFQAFFENVKVERNNIKKLSKDESIFPGGKKGFWSYLKLKPEEKVIDQAQRQAILRSIVSTDPNKSAKALENITKASEQVKKDILEIACQKGLIGSTEDINALLKKLNDKASRKIIAKGLYQKINNQIRNYIDKGVTNSQTKTSANYSSDVSSFLSKVVSASVSCFFVANDFGNYSIAANGNIEEAKKERKSKFIQEFVSRAALASVLIYAIQAMFKDKCNKSLAFSFGTSLFASGIAQVLGRIITGRQIIPTKKSEFKKLNEKNSNNPAITKNNPINGNSPLSSMHLMTKFMQKPTAFNSDSKNLSFKGHNSIDQKNQSASKNISFKGGLLTTILKNAKWAGKYKYEYMNSDKFIPLMEKLKNADPIDYGKTIDYIVQEFNKSRIEAKDIIKDKISDHGQLINAIQEKIGKEMGIPVGYDGKYKSALTVGDSILIPVEKVRNLGIWVARQLKIMKPAEHESSRNIDFVKLTLKKIEKATKKYSSDEEFKKEYSRMKLKKGFNSISYDASDLSTLNKVFGGVFGVGFGALDAYNLTMNKTNGDEKSAWQKVRERFSQDISRILVSGWFVGGSNSTFREFNNASLPNSAILTIGNVSAYEAATRLSVGAPILLKTREQLTKMEKENSERKGFVGWWYKNVSKLTGKKPIKISKPDKTTQNKPSSTPVIAGKTPVQNLKPQTGTSLNQINKSILDSNQAGSIYSSHFKIMEQEKQKGLINASNNNKTVK